MTLQSTKSQFKYPKQRLLFLFVIKSMSYCNNDMTNSIRNKKLLFQVTLKNTYYVLIVFEFIH